MVRNSVGETPKCCRKARENASWCHSRHQATDDGPVGAAQPQGRSLQPQPAHVFPTVSPTIAETPDEMIGREVSQPRQLLQDQLLVEVILDVKLHPQNAVPVSLLCSWYARDA